VVVAVGRPAGTPYRVQLRCPGAEMRQSWGQGLGGDWVVSGLSRRLQVEFALRG
jgi:hypothetical protein